MKMCMLEINTPKICYSHAYCSDMFVVVALLNYFYPHLSLSLSLDYFVIHFFSLVGLRFAHILKKTCICVCVMRVCVCVCVFACACVCVCVCVYTCPQ